MRDVVVCAIKNDNSMSLSAAGVGNLYAQRFESKMVFVSLMVSNPSNTFRCLGSLASINFRNTAGITTDKDLHCIPVPFNLGNAVALPDLYWVILKD